VGKVGPSQLERLGRVLQKEGEAGQQRIVLIHHPPGKGKSDVGHELLDTGPLGAVIAKHGAELVLHGHEHVEMDYALTGPTTAVPVHGIASGTSRSLRPGREASFSVYDCADGSFHRRRWRLEGNDFKPLD
jgi:3',5'-cyclic AMP phosphodiesterase CpdA